MRVTRTISTSVEEKDWKSCCPTCVMQVPPPPPAPGPRALTLPLPPAVGEAKVRLRRHGGSASLSSLGALALIGAGLVGFEPTRLPLLGAPFPRAKRTGPTPPKTPPWGGRGCARQRRTEGVTAGKQAGQRARGASEILSGPASNACLRALFLCPGTRLQIEQAELGCRPPPEGAEGRQDWRSLQSGPPRPRPQPGAAGLLRRARSPGLPPRAHQGRQFPSAARGDGVCAGTAEMQISQLIKQPPRASATL